MRLVVWAPHAERLEVEAGGKRQALAKGGRGYWDADVPALVHGADYQLFIDGRGPFPDPRAASQPYGPLGASRVVDPARFAWTDGAFRAPPLAAGVLYEMHVGTFTEAGTFAAAIAKLPHLVALGITHVELMPVAEFSGARGWGYDGVDLFAPHHAYGGPEGLAKLVDACHGAGLAVILDVVYNHLGPAGNVLGAFGPYFTETYQTPWGAAVNLDGRGSDEVRRFLCDNALSWLRDFHCDGLRLDAVHAFQDHSSVPLLEQLTGEVQALERATGRPYCLIAESDYNDPRMVRPLDAGGLGMDAQWNDDFHHALHAVLTGERTGYYADFGTIGALAKSFEDVFVRDGGYSAFRQKSHGRPAGETPRGRFITYLQNHDQIGNRARGERMGALVSRPRQKIGAALVLVSPFVPMLFQGEEWGAQTPFHYFTDHADEALGRAVREGRRREFVELGWNAEDVPDPQAVGTFTASRLDWRELETSAGHELFAWHRALIALRREVGPSARKAVAHFDEAAGWMLVQTGDLAVAFNLGKGPARIALPPMMRPWTLALSAGDGVVLAGGRVEVPAEGVAVLRAI